MENILLILGLSLLGISIYLITYTLLKSQGASDTLAWATGEQPDETPSPIINFSRPLVQNFTLRYAKMIQADDYRKSIANKLMTAGLGRSLKVDEFIGLQILWGVLFPTLLLALNVALGLGLPLFVCLLCGALGAYYPHMFCNQEKKKRIHSAQLDLPFFIDLLALSTEAGLDFIGAISRIVDKAPGSVLAQEFNQVLKDVRLGSSRVEAMRKMSSRLDMSEVTSFVAVIADADETGASVSKALKDQSIQMRLERFVRAEKAGATASQVMMIPLVLFIVPAVFIMVGAPVFLSFSG